MKAGKTKVKNEVICGDCLEVMKEMEGNSIDLVLTDPPYKLSQRYTSSTDSDNVIGVASIYNCAQESKRVLKDGGLAVVFYDNRLLPVALDAFKKAGFKYIRALTLYRRAGSAHMMCGFMSTSDFILIFQNGEAKLNFYGSCSHDVYIKDKMEKESAHHPAQKPLWVIKDLIQRLSKEGDLILDPFAGSGTTGRACKDLGRNFILIEKEEKYIEVINRRLQQEVLF